MGVFDYSKNYVVYTMMDIASSAGKDIYVSRMFIILETSCNSSSPPLADIVLFEFFLLGFPSRF